MKVSRDRRQSTYLYDTPVENIFINEYMPLAPEGYVKVYLLARMYVDSGEELTEETLSRALSMEGQEVKKALDYWIRAGLIRRNGEGFCFLSLKEQLYGNPTSRAEGSSGRELLNNKDLKEIIESLQQRTGTFFSGGDLQEIASWIDDWKASKAVILGAADHCVKRGKTNIRYIGRVVKDWVGSGLSTKEDVERRLSEADEQHYAFRRVMRALGFHRNATEEEQRIIASWIDELGCTMEEILEACRKTSGIPNPNINYVNAVLTRKRGRDPESGQASQSRIKAYYQYLREQAEARAAEQRREIRMQAPKVAAAEDALIECNRNLTQILISGGADKLEQMERIKGRIEALDQERTKALTEAGIPIDYGDVQYRCARCEDTGILGDGSRCSCWMERAEEAKHWEAP